MTKTMNPTTETVTIAKVKTFDTRTDGTALLTKNGDPMTKVLIELEDGRKASGLSFPNPQTNPTAPMVYIEAGDRLPLKFIPSGQYLNFELTAESYRELYDRHHPKAETPLDLSEPEEESELVF